MATSRTKRPGPTPIAAVQTLLRSSGLRSTSARIAVLQALHDATEPNSHAELFEALAGKGLDRGTIYRVLTDLADAGIVGRTDLGDHVWRFELKKGVAGTVHSDEHPHFVCIDCGGVSCLPGVSLQVRGSASAPRSVAKRQVAIQLKGRCDRCA